MKMLLLIFSLIPITSLANNDFIGLWKFPGRAAWVQVSDNSKVYQCRIDIDGSVVTSEGELVGVKIIWVKIWEKDILTIENENLYLTGKYGKFGFASTIKKMAKKCNNPL